MLGSLLLGSIQAALVILACCVCRDKYGRQLQGYIASVDHLMMLAFRNPKGGVLHHDCLFTLMDTNAGAGDDVDQFRPIMNVIISSSRWGKDGMTEREFLYSFFVWGEQDLNLPLEWGWDFDSFFFRCLYDFQFLFLS